MNKTNVIYNEDALKGLHKIKDQSVDLIVTDPPYGLGKDYGNDSDKQETEQFLEWTKSWIDLAIQKLKPTGSFYIFTTWRYSPEIFSYMKIFINSKNSSAYSNYKNSTSVFFRR